MPAPARPLSYAALLLRGLLAGLIAGLLAGGFAYAAGESRIDAAIAIEQAAAVEQAAAMERAAVEQSAAVADHHDEAVSRDVQRAGLFLATGLYGVAMGGLLATAYALLRRRLRTRSDTDAVLALAGSALLGVVLVPFVKYPANPPAVGDPATVDARTISWVALVVIGLVAVWAGVVAARAVPATADRWLPRAAATGAFVLVVAVGYVALPPAGDVPATFPAGLLWDFRVASLGTQVVLWVALGLAYAALLARARPTPARPPAPAGQ